MEKLRITDDDYAKHLERCQPVPPGESVKRSIARKDPVYFVVNQLGIRPYVWQARFLDNLAKGKNTIACTSRQVGKTAVLAWFALWACSFNTLPLGTTGKTRIVFISKTEGQAMKVISDIREFMRVGDERVKSLTNGKVDKFFSNMIASGSNTSNTKSQITLMNGCQMISLPPTDAARGYTASQEFIDEIGFIGDDVIRDVLLPIVSATGNRVSCTSTPNGKQGWFYKQFDPEDQRPSHEFERLWVPYQCIRHDDPKRCELLDGRRQDAIILGEERSFKQEYEADFTASSSSYFRDEDVTACMDHDIDLVDGWSGECDMGIDFGKMVSRTVVSITCLEKHDDEKKIRLLYQYEYGSEKGTGADLVEDVGVLLKKYNVQRIVVEDCPQSAFFQQACVKHGWRMTLFNPTADKNKQYGLFRAWLRQGKVRFPNVPDLVQQMRGLICVQLPTRERIEHGAGLKDDRIDSFMLSSYHQTEKESRLRVLDL